MIDPFIANLYRERTARSWGGSIVLNAWQGIPASQRAAMIYAQGDPHRAGACGGDGWKMLADGDLAGALKVSRNQQDPYSQQLEAETLIAAGSLVAGLERLRRLHNKGSISASLSLMRRLHILGDHAGAGKVAITAPWHSSIAILGARAALACKNYSLARKLLEPLLLGIVHVPDSETSGNLALMTASLLVQTQEIERLQHFARSILLTQDLPEPMIPPTARIAWMAGYGQQAWERFSKTKSEWNAAACLELAVLSGQVDVAESWGKVAGPIGAPTAPAIQLLKGSAIDEQATAEALKIFQPNAEVHIWRTHPSRWHPWIEAAKKTKAKVEVFDLSKGKLPNTKSFAHVALDDSALLELLKPEPTSTKLRTGNKIWVGKALSDGFSATLTWPKSETEKIYKMLPKATSQNEAAVLVLSAEDAMRMAMQGIPVIAIAPPGDPFWAGPIPEQAWPGMHVIRPSNEQGWHGAGLKVVTAARTLFQVLKDYDSGERK